MTPEGAGWLDAYLSQQPEAMSTAPDAPRPGEWRGVWTWIELTEDGEILPASLEILGRGRAIADELGTRNVAVVLGHGISDAAATLGEYGADLVYVLDDAAFSEFYLEAAREVLIEHIPALRPELVLFPATIQGRNLAGQLSIALEAGLVPNCNALSLDATQRLVIGQQSSFEERLLSDVVCREGRPQLFTLTPGTSRRPPRESGRRAPVVSLTVPADLPTTPRVRTVGPAPAPQRGPAHYDAIVAGGLGVASRAGFDLVRGLAKEIGAYAGATRGAVACGWAEPEHLITVTRGHLTPRLYVACGVIGEYDHLRAIEDAKFVVALTADPEAPIVERSDLIGVGEPDEILPRLLDHLRKAKDDRVHLGPVTPRPAP